MNIGRMELPALRAETLPNTRDAVVAALKHRATSAGFFHARSPKGDAFLFFHEGVVWCGGEADDDGPMAMSPASFFERLPLASELVVADVDLPLFLCAAVIFRKPPAVHVPTSFVDGDQLLKTLASLGKDAVLALHKDGAWALAFCRNGEPVALYGTPALPSTHAASVGERVLELIYSTRDVVIDLYDEIRLPRAADAGQTAEQLQAFAATDRRRPMLVVSLGERVVFRHRIDREETLVGRGLDAQLPLDNLSISRRHAIIRSRGDRVVVEDLGSENGVVFRGERVPSAELRPGDAVQLGKYSVGYATYTASEPVVEARRPMLSADMDTVNIAARRSASIEHRGLRHRVKSVVFTIGSAPDASLRIRGMFVAGVHAVIEPDGAGGYALRREGRARALKVNGAVVERHTLKDGDEIVLAGETVRFLFSA